MELVITASCVYYTLVEPDEYNYAYAAGLKVSFLNSKDLECIDKIYITNSLGNGIGLYKDSICSKPVENLSFGINRHMTNYNIINNIKDLIRQYCQTHNQQMKVLDFTGDIDIMKYVNEIRMMYWS